MDILKPKLKIHPETTQIITSENEKKRKREIDPPKKIRIKEENASVTTVTFFNTPPTATHGRAVPQLVLYAFDAGEERGGKEGRRRISRRRRRKK